MTVKPVAWHISEDSWRRVTSWTSAAIVYHLPRYWFWNWSYHLPFTPILILELDCFYCFIALLSYLRPVRLHYYQFCDLALEKVSSFGCSGWEGYFLGLECIMWWSVTYAVIRGVERAWARMPSSRMMIRHLCRQQGSRESNLRQKRGVKISERYHHVWGSEWDAEMLTDLVVLVIAKGDQSEMRRFCEDLNQIQWK